MNKKIILIGGFFIIFFGTAFVQYNNTVSEKKEATISTISAKLIIIDGKKNQSIVRIKAGSTALQLLQSTHKIITKGEKENAFVTTIDKRTASPSRKEFWAFYLNSKQAQVGAGTYVVRNNDIIEWKIETY